MAEKHGISKKEQRYLFSNYFAKQFLINSEMAKFYLEMGLKIIKIYKFIEFFYKNVFLLWDKKGIVNIKLLADTDKTKTVIALTNLQVCLLNKEKHRNITYHSEETVNKSI